MNFRLSLEEARKQPGDPDTLSELAEAALQEGEEEQALSVIGQSLRESSSARLWQWKGLLERSIDEHELALQSFGEAARLDPGSASIAHGQARTALEAGLPAEALFERALQLSPSDAAVFQGLVAARLAAGRGDRAEAELDSIVARRPLWIEGHNQLAQLRSMLGKRSLASASLERALEHQPDQVPLWCALFDLNVKSGDFAGLAEAIERARETGVAEEATLPHRAIASAELGQTEFADDLFSRLLAAGGPELPIWRMRHLLRSRPREALPLIDRELAGPHAALAWPYAAVAWRLNNDPRWDWLSRDGALVAVHDLDDDLPPLDRLADVLRSVHTSGGEYLDQSVRGGTQTDGPLLARIEPEIRKLRSAIVGAVERYVANLPERDETHPLLSAPRNRQVRFSGSWSVRLKDRGYHASHVHPQGWISSALYVALPQEPDSERNAGWLHLGAPSLGLGDASRPLRLIQPKPGRLVLFPSWMWHGTRPFSAGERLTVAFDVAPPR